MNNFYIFSVFQSGLDHATNLNNHMGTLAALAAVGVTYEVVNGVYKGTGELSIRVPISRGDLVQALARYHNQESILLVQGGHGTLLTTAGDTIAELGAWSKVYGALPESYTEIGGEKFACIPESSIATA